MSHLRDSKDDGSGDEVTQAPPPEVINSPKNKVDSSGSGASTSVDSPGLSARFPHFSTRAWLSIVLGLGSLLHLWALRTGFLLDDFIHISMLRGHFPSGRSPLDLYNFVDDTNRSEMIERGILPWWTHPELTIKFFRPLSSGLRWLDHAVLGSNAFLMHLHSLLWWAAMVIAAFVLYRAFFGERIARLATFVFALAPCHAMPIAWLANRDALISLGLGIPGLYVYTRARETRSLRDVALAFILFSLAFAGGEYTLSFIAYVATFEVVRRDDTLSRRVVGSLPFVVPLSLYMGVRTALHYGTIGSGYYNDPLRAPDLFLYFAPRRFSALLLQAWLALDNETVTWGIPWWAIVLAALTLIALLVRVLRHALAESAPEPRRAALWLGAGSIIAMVPILAVVPNQRTLGAVMFGVAAIVGLALDAAWFPKSAEPRRGMAELAQLTALALGFAHLIHGPVTTALLGAKYYESSSQFSVQMATLRERFPDASAAEPVVVRATGGAFFAPFGMYEDGELPARFAILSWATHVLMLRTGERSFDLLSSAESGIFPWGEGNLYLDTAWEIEEGDVFQAPGYAATVTRIQEGHTTRVHFDLDEEFAARAFLNETPKAYFQAELPIEGDGRPYDADH